MSGNGGIGALPSAHKPVVELEAAMSGNGGIGALPSAQTAGREEIFTDCVLTLKLIGTTIATSSAKTKSKAIVRFIMEYLLRAFLLHAQPVGVDGFEMF